MAIVLVVVLMESIDMDVAVAEALDGSIWRTQEKELHIGSSSGKGGT